MVLFVQHLQDGLSLTVISDVGEDIFHCFVDECVGCELLFIEFCLCYGLLYVAVYAP